MTTALDYVTIGVDRWPEKSRLDKAMRFFTVYLESIQSNETAVIELLDAFTNWHRPGLTFSWVLDIIGNVVLGQARPATFGDEEYRVLLLARTLVRTSRATLTDVTRVVDYLASINGGTGSYVVVGDVPEHWSIGIFNINLSPQWTELYKRLIFDTIGAVDSFDLTLNTSVSTLYDSITQVYDVALYS